MNLSIYVIMNNNIIVTYNYNTINFIDYFNIEHYVLYNPSWLIVILDNFNE